MKKTTLRRISQMICLALLLECLGMGGFVTNAQAAESGTNPEDYSYEVTPIIEPFEYYLYVKTDNPDPTSFRFIDKDSSNYYYSSDSDDAGVIELSERLFADVVFEDEDTYRVNGGYIFHNIGNSDGGKLTLQKNVSDEWQDTNVTVNCTKLTDYISYIIDNYTDANAEFFDNMDAAQSALGKVALYPKAVQDTDSPNEYHPYPAFAESPYKELSLNAHYEMYAYYEDGCLLLAAYPYVIDSLGFPGTMGSIAKRLSDDCTVDSGSMHYAIEVTYDGETESYGGAGAGTSNDFYKSCIDKIFTFTGASDDYSVGKELDDFREKYVEFQSASEVVLEEWKDILTGDTLKETIGAGSWVCIGREGSSGDTFAYFSGRSEDRVIFASSCWVDGHYIDAWETIEPCADFEDHPNSNIMLTNQTYTDRDGVTHTGDILYIYKSEYDNWQAISAYTNGGYLTDSEELPEQFILTREQAEAMEISYALPTEGRYYNGREYPGTPYHLTNVTGISTEVTEMTLYVDHLCELPVTTITPADASFPKIIWESEDESIAYTWSDSFEGISEGTTIITGTTYDGGYQIKIKVTVETPPNSVTINEAGYALYVGETTQATATVLPEEAQNKNLIWSIEDPEIATVDEKTGVITGVSEGDTWIHVKAEAGGAWDYSRRVTVYLPDPTAIDLEDQVVGAGQSISLTSGITPENAEVYWEVLYNKEDVISVEDGIVTGKKVIKGYVDAPGSVWIQAGSYYNNLRDTARITVLFNDVMDDSAYFYKPVYWAYNHDITTGKSGGERFAPWDTCTRAQIVTFLWRLAGKPDPTGGNPFNDISEDAYYYKAVLWAYENGITTGRRGGKTFDPNGTCTRREIVTFLWRYAGKPEPKNSTSKFTDVQDASAYYYKAVLWAVENDITTGKKATNYKTFDPLGECTRGMSVTFIYRYAN